MAGNTPGSVGVDAKSRSLDQHRVLDLLHEQHRGRRRKHKPTGLFDRTRDSRVRASDNRPQTEVPPTGDTRRAHSRGATWDNPIRHHQKLKPWRWRVSSLTAPQRLPFKIINVLISGPKPSRPSIRASVSCALR